MFQRNASLITCVIAGALVMSCAPRSTKFSGVDGIEAAGVNASGTSFDIGALANTVGTIPISTGGQANLGTPSGWILLSQIYAFIGAANATNPPSNGSLMFSQYVDASKVTASKGCASTDQYIPIYGFTGGKTAAGTAFAISSLNIAGQTCLAGISEAAPGAPAVPNLTQPTISAISDVSASNAGVAFQISGSFPRLAVSPNAGLEVSMTCTWAASTGIKGSMTFSTGSGDITFPQGRSQSASAISVLLSPRTAPTSSSAASASYPNVCMIDVTVGYWQSASAEAGLTLGNALASLTPHTGNGNGASPATATLNVTGPNGAPLPFNNGVYTATVGEQLTYTWNTSGLDSVTSYYYANANSYNANANSTSCANYTMADALTVPPTTIPWINAAGQYLAGSGPSTGFTYGVTQPYNNFANPAIGVVALCQLGITYTVGITGLDEAPLPHKAEISIFVAAATSQTPNLTSLTVNAGSASTNAQSQPGAGMELGDNAPFTLNFATSDATQVQVCSSLPNSTCLTSTINSTTNQGFVTTSVTNAGNSVLSVVFTATPFNGGIAGTPTALTMKIDPATNSSTPASLTPNSFGVCNGGSDAIAATLSNESNALEAVGSTTLCWAGSNLSNAIVMLSGPGISSDMPANDLSSIITGIPVGTSTYTLTLDNCAAATGVTCSESVTLTVNAPASTPTLTSLSITPSGGSVLNENISAGSAMVTLTAQQSVVIQYAMSPANAELVIKENSGASNTQTTSSGSFTLTAAQIATSPTFTLTPTLSGGASGASYFLLFNVQSTTGNAAPPAISNFTATSAGSSVSGSSFVAKAGANIAFTFTASMAAAGSFLISSPDGVTSIAGGLNAGTFNVGPSSFGVVASSDGIWTLRVSNNATTSAANCTPSNCATATMRVDVWALVNTLSVSANGQTAQINQTLTGVTPGQALTFAWTTNGAESVSMAFGMPTPNQSVQLSNTGPNASAQVLAPTSPGTYVYSLVPSGPSGLGIYQLIYVTVSAATGPSVALTATADTTCTGNPMGGPINNGGTLNIAYGQCFVVGWTITGATSITGTGDLLSGSLPQAMGSYGFAATTNTGIPLRQALGATAAGTHTFTVSAAGSSGTTTATVTINVSAPAAPTPSIISFTGPASVSASTAISFVVTTANVPTGDEVVVCAGSIASCIPVTVAANGITTVTFPSGITSAQSPTNFFFQSLVNSVGTPQSISGSVASISVSVAAAPPPPPVTVSTPSVTGGTAGMYPGSTTAYEAKWGAQVSFSWSVGNIAAGTTAELMVTADQGATWTTACAPVAATASMSCTATLPSAASNLWFKSQSGSVSSSGVQIIGVDPDSLLVGQIAMTNAGGGGTPTCGAIWVQATNVPANPANISVTVVDEADGSTATLTPYSSNGAGFDILVSGVTTSSGRSLYADFMSSPSSTDPNGVVLLVTNTANGSAQATFMNSQTFNTAVTCN